MNDRLVARSAAVLKGRGWLSHQAAAFADDVLRRGSPVEYPAGSVVYRLGDPAGGVYGVVEGVVAVTAVPAGLQPAIVQHAGIGSWLGVMPFLGAPRRQVELRAVGEAVLFHLPLPAMEAMVADDPQVSRVFGEIAAENVGMFLQVIEDLLQPDTGRRVAATLLRATRGGESRIPLTQLDLAAMANASRRQVNTILQAFAARGWIAQGYGSVTVLDANGLRSALERGDLLDKGDGYSPPKVLT